MGRVASISKPYSVEWISLTLVSQLASASQANFEKAAQDRPSRVRNLMKAIGNIVNPVPIEVLITGGTGCAKLTISPDQTMAAVLHATDIAKHNLKEDMAQRYYSSLEIAHYASNRLASNSSGSAIEDWDEIAHIWEIDFNSHEMLILPSQIAEYARDHWNDAWLPYQAHVYNTEK